MAVPDGKRFPMKFDELSPQGAYVVGEVPTECQSREEKARNRPVRPRTDETGGPPIVKVTIADPSAEKDWDRSVTVEIAARVPPVPPAAVNGLPFRPVVLKGSPDNHGRRHPGRRSGSPGWSGRPAGTLSTRQAPRAPTRGPALPVPLMSDPLRHKGRVGS
ncbi:MAG: hypothetical protein JO063_14120 [Pseudonocardiales bacterium]|nr:hypothetical protein [Pseudonocardiales bacterium]MBV9030127.1 hypothetical protein [Pseudonocardiales bacterium]MBW0011222.1 hypothetical protein [Pseudonocardiales bacterium]